MEKQKTMLSLPEFKAFLSDRFGINIGIKTVNDWVALPNFPLLIVKKRRYVLINLYEQWEANFLKDLCFHYNKNIGSIRNIVRIDCEQYEKIKRLSPREIFIVRLIFKDISNHELHFDIDRLANYFGKYLKTISFVPEHNIFLGQVDYEHILLSNEYTKKFFLGKDYDSVAVQIERYIKKYLDDNWE